MGKVCLCKGCDTPIRWQRTEAGRLTPLNIDGSTHWATCTAVAQFKAKKPKQLNLLGDEQKMNVLGNKNANLTLTPGKHSEMLIRTEKRRPVKLNPQRFFWIITRNSARVRLKGESYLMLRMNCKQFLLLSWAVLKKSNPC